MDEIRSFLEAYGLWAIVVLLALKLVTGVLVAVKENEFKWYYLKEFFRRDFLEALAYGIFVYFARHSGLEELDNPVILGATGAVLVAGLLGGVMKNFAHLSSAFAANIPSSFREPARLRLGNPKNNL